MPRKSGAFFTRVRKAGTCAGMNCVFIVQAARTIADAAQAVLVSVAAFDGPSSAARD